MVNMISEADTAYKNNDYKKAVEICNEVVVKEPDNIKTIEGLTQSLYRLKKYSQADEAAQRTLDKDPGSVIAHKVKAYIYARKRNYEQSEFEIRRAYEVDPNSSEILAFLGGLLLLKKNSKEGISMLQDAIRINYDEWMAHYNLGLAMSAQSAFNEAIHEFVIAYKMHPSLQTGLALLDSHIYKQRLWALFMLLFIFALSFILHSLFPLYILVSVTYLMGVRFFFDRKWGKSLLILVSGTALLLLGRYIFKQ